VACAIQLVSQEIIKSPIPFILPPFTAPSSKGSFLTLTFLRKQITMGKNKGTKGKASATPVVATPAKALTAVKDGRVSKPAQSAKTKAKELAKAAVTKTSKKPKEPTPSSESESESEASSVDSDEESEVEEAKPTVTKVNGAKRINGVSEVKDSDSSDFDSSESESENEAPVPAPKANGIKATAPTNGANLSGSDDEDSEDSEGSSESDEETPAKAKVMAKTAEVKRSLLQLQNNC
jgi:nucleolin